MIVTDNTPSQLYALSRKIERAKRPSRSQDGVIWKVLVEKKGDVWVKVDGLWLRQDPKDTVAFDTPPSITTSIDAAEALFDKALGFYGYQLERPVARGKPRRDRYNSRCFTGRHSCHGWGPNGAMALLSAGLILLASRLSDGVIP
jgi:hypothetical protein